MKLNLQIGAVGETMVHGTDEAGPIGATVSVFDGRKLICTARTDADMHRLAAVILYEADVQDWAGTAGTVSYTLEHWAQAVLTQKEQENAKNQN